MRLLTKTLLERKVGWIGLDVGSSTVKIAQIARAKTGWHIVASAAVPRQQTWHEGTELGAKPVPTCNELQAAQSLQPGYRGRKVAAALPMSLCDIHRFDRDLEHDPQAMRLLRETIETATQQSVENFQCDYWSSPQTEESQAWTQAITVPSSWTDQLCEDVSRAGWSCELIDGLPLALARAVRLVHPEPTSEPLAVLDWGSSRATLCLVENGLPVYVRCLKEGGLHHLLDALKVALQVSDREAQRLLEDYGMSDSFDEEEHDIAQLIQETIADPLNQLVGEIQRSLSHFHYVVRSPQPELLYLVGGGAMIRDLDVVLSTRLELSVRHWSLNDQSTGQSARDSRSDCLWAPAVALSALAWEAL